jgi:hypothetical protein
VTPTDRPTQLTEHVLAAAEDFAAFPLTALAETPTPEGTRRARALAGALMWSATVVTDQLFDDLHTRTLDPDGDLADTWLLADLPAMFRDRYTPAFTRAFLVAFLDLTTRLTRPWTAPSCVAQELGVRLLTDTVEVTADLAGLTLPPHWRDELYELLLEDTDHEYLYDAAADGFLDDPTFGPPGMVSLHIDDWFTPFHGHTPLPPYLR